MRKRLLIFICWLFVFPLGLLAQEVPLQDTSNTMESTMPAITLTADDLEEGEIGGDNISGLLTSSKDVYVNSAGYQFGSARYRIRGLNSEWTSISINGVPMNDMESGRAYWSTWGGLNDVTRERVFINGSGYSDDNFGNIGGFTNILTYASDYRPQTKVTYSMTNRSYRNRIMFTHSTGMMENGWAFTVSGSRRWAQEGYVEGTFYDAWSYFLAVEKKLNDHHTLNFTGFGAPRKYGRSGASVQEAYDLTNNNFYNPNWGYQEGEKRNARVNNYHTPVLMLSHKWKINDDSKLESSVAYSFGHGGGTALSWYTGNDPRPDYYKNLPSFYQNTQNNLDMYMQVYNEWKNDPSRAQLNWDQFYIDNRSKLATVNNVDGVEGNSYQGYRSNYIVEERRYDQSKIVLSTIFNQQVSDELSFNAGLNASMYKGFQFKLMSDLLGGDFWLDVDKYNERDYLPGPGKDIPDEAQSDLNNPNNIIEEGDKFGYDFVANINLIETYGQAKYSLNKFDFYGGLKLSYTNFWRTGNMKTGSYPDRSYGDGEKHGFFDYALKGGATYKLSGRNYFKLNTSYQTQAPYFRNAYESSRTRDGVIEGLTSEKVFSVDGSYIARFPKFSGRLTGFYSTMKEGFQVRMAYIEGRDGGVFGSYVLRDVDKRNMGMELGADINLVGSLNLVLAGGVGNYIYTNRPEVLIIPDNADSDIVQDSEELYDIAYLKNYHVGGFPQTAGSAGLKYFGSNYWFAGFNVNFFDDIYIDLFADRRTEFNVDGYTTDHPYWNEILEQEKLEASFTVDAFVGKSWKIDDYYIRLNLNASNILNNTSFAFGGYEQYRFDRENPDRFGNKYFYLYGAQFFLNLNFSF